MNKNGASMVTLVITIIVIVILAAIAFIASGNIFGKASTAKFVSEFKDFSLEVKSEYQKLKNIHTSDLKTDDQLYYMVATGEKLAMGQQPVASGKTGDIGITLIPENISGDDFFEMTTTSKTFSRHNSWQYETKYVTDVGETFVLPGFMVEEGAERRWYVNESKYYVSEMPYTISGEKPKLTDKIKVGDYVEYVPISTQYSTNAQNTGRATQTLTTENKNWKVIYANETTGEIWITTDGVVNANKVRLSGATGYLKGATELNNICDALYSNSTLGLRARSITVEDINKICNYTPTGETRWAIYPYGSAVSGVESYNGREYTKVSHGYATQRIYAYDGGGKSEKDANGLEYRTPEQGNPVYVTQTYYDYVPTEINNIVGESDYWVASPCTYLIPSSRYAGFYLRSVSFGYLSGAYLCNSSTGAIEALSGLRPIITLNSGIRIDTSDETKDGKSPATAWVIKN